MNILASPTGGVLASNVTIFHEGLSDAQIICDSLNMSLDTSCYVPDAGVYTEFYDCEAVSTALRIYAEKYELVSESLAIDSLTRYLPHNRASRALDRDTYTMADRVDDLSEAVYYMHVAYRQKLGLDDCE